jgi:hypothetical protein
MDNLVPTNTVRRQGQRYNNEEDRRKGYRAAQLRYAMQLWHCDVCNAVLLRGNKSAHLKSSRHQKSKIHLNLAHSVNEITNDSMHVVAEKLRARANELAHDPNFDIVERLTGGILAASLIHTLTNSSIKTS